MAVDYYKLLQVQRNAKHDDLRKAAEAKFKQISEAYDVDKLGTISVLEQLPHTCWAPCSLEDLCNGTTKKMRISSGRRSTVEEVLTIDIKPGWKKGTKITFPEKGNDVQRGVVPADIVFIIDEKPHNRFKRDDNDLIVTRNISLADALTGRTQLTTLDGRNLTVSIDTISSLIHEEVVEGEGMPIQKEASKKGNLILKFKIEFPKLTTEQKTGIKQLLTSS